MTVPKRCALYLRVSTQDQSCEIQRADLTAFVEVRGWVIHQIYEDKATGTNSNRPMLKEMLKDARERRFDVLLTYKLDRFARSLKDMVVMLQELNELGVEFISLRDNIDLSTSSGRLMMHLLGAFAEFEASLIRERVRAGIQHAKATGKKLGRPKTRNDVNIRVLRTQGQSFREIAESLQTSLGSVQRALTEVQTATHSSRSSSKS